MGSIYKRGKIWWLAYIDAAGERQLRSSGQRDERVAKQSLVDVEASISLQERATKRPTTVAAWAEVWISGRKNWTKDLNEGHLKKHVLPVLGAKKLIDVTQADVRELVIGWRDGGAMAPRTIRNVWWTMSRMFSDALVKGMLEKSPCVLVKGDRPKIQDKDRQWRKKAVFTKSEAEQLFSDSRVPTDRRIAWALGFIGGLRLGEISALQWQDYDDAREPLGCLSINNSYTRINGVVKGTKTETARDVPVHPTLATILANWREAGWEKQFGAEPKPEDLLLPNRAGRHLTDNNIQAGRTLDFAALSMRPRRFHDSRRTFISLAQAGGATKDVLQLVTHGAPAEVMDLYTTLPWPTLCQAVSCLQLQSLLQSPEVTMETTEFSDVEACPRRDSNPSCNTPDDHTSAVPHWEGRSRIALTPRQNDGDCSNVATPLRARLRALEKAYGRGSK